MIFGTLTPSRFLKQYWQKRPLLVRGAFPDICDPITPDELAGLSLEDDVDSRLVMERGGKKPWQVTLGPQHAAQLKKLPSSHWTLLVQGVDRFIPGVAALLEEFRFIPDWRVEDVMVSFAPRGGTVGPHIDSYDVFLIQGKGRRRWRLDKNAPRALRPGLDLRILKQFHATQDWILEPGDMLYLPPDLAHYGTALEDCLTYSVGFRAPSGLDLLLAMQEHLAASGASARYTDPDLRPVRRPGEIPPGALKRFRKLLESALQRLPDSEFNPLVARLLTEPKGSAVFEPQRVTTAALRARLKRGALFSRVPGSRLAFLKNGGRTELFGNGRRFETNRSLNLAGPLLTRQRHFSGNELSAHFRKPGFLQLLADLIQTGIFQFES